MPFRAKGAVLRGAPASVHEVSPAAVPAAEGAAGAEPREHYLVELTITPGEPKGPFGLWEPGELRLVRPASVLRPESDEARFRIPLKPRQSNRLCRDNSGLLPPASPR